MRRVVVSMSILLLLLLARHSILAQTPPPPTAPPSPLSTPGLSPIPTPTPESLALPGSAGAWWKTIAQALSRYGPWGATIAIFVLIVGGFLWKVGGAVAEEEAKGFAARLRKGARLTWHRVTRRIPREERDLLKHVCTICEQLELKGFVKETIIIVSLESIYVPLTAKGDKSPGSLGEGMPLLRTAEGSGEVTLTNLIARHPCLVLVGEAGSGKTTFLKYVAHTAARCYDGKKSDRADWLPDPNPLPLFLPLHGFGNYLKDQKLAERESPSPDLLRDYIVHHLRHLDLPEGWIAERIKTGNILLLLDGLDEVARFEDRRFITELVAQFASFYDRCRVIVTTRPQGYEGAAQLGGSFERRDINPLGWPEDIRFFLERWNEAIKCREEQGNLSAHGRRLAHDNAQKLMSRLENAPNVRELANNPLLLTVMAIVHYNVGELPERRADLYDAATELLLGWDKRMGRELQAPPLWLDALSAAHRRLPLEELAFDFQDQRVIEQVRADTLSFLAGHFLAGQGSEAQEAAHVQAEEYLNWVTGRTRVLQDIGGMIRFYRKPFQEYLAARKLGRTPDLQDRVRYILREDWRDRWWDETLLLTVGQLITTNPQKASDLLTAIQQLPSPPETPHYNVTFVARALADVPEGLLSHVWRVRESVVEHLAKAVAAVEAVFSPQARLEAGVALGTLGDPRPGTGVVAAEAGRSLLPDIVWVQVPAGPFLMGSTDEQVEYWKDWTRQRIENGTDRIEGIAPERLLEIYTAWWEIERGQHALEMPAFLIARYPVTNAQYRCFTDADGYNDPRWWGGETSPAWAWRTGKPRLDWQRTDRPDFWHDPRFNGPNQPVVGVTWYEAMAFCRWLAEQLRTPAAVLGPNCKLRVWRDDKLETLDYPEPFAVRLPTEAEWEKAVRGTNAWTWPWGNEWKEMSANTREANLGQSSPVGVLPVDASPYGVVDVAGNVREWTLSLWRTDWIDSTFNYPYHPDDAREDTVPGDEMLRVIRGGSWGMHYGAARCAARNYTSAHYSNYGGGFRCVSPVSPSACSGC